MFYSTKGLAEENITKTNLARVFRAESGLILANLISHCGDIQLAEDALQEACVTASKQWQTQGALPNNPGAWLLTVARRRLIDQLRASSRRSGEQVLSRALHSLQQTQPELESSQEIPDERLKLIFTCCHPALSSEARLALTLKTLCGLSVAEIARAFLVSHSAMNQRLVRAKNKIKLSGIAYRIPTEAQLSDRLDSVLAVIYLIFNESYSAYEGQSLTREDLGNEAVRLGQLLNTLLPTPEVKGLLALMLLHQSRDAARSSTTRSFIPLEEQDRNLWDSKKTSEGQALLLTAMAKKKPGKYQIQAAISALHAQATYWQNTDWRQILMLYDTLLKVEPSPIVELNMLAVLTHSGKHSKALKGLDALEIELKNYQPFYAARAEVHAKLNNKTNAARDYNRSIKLSKNTPERDYLQSKLTKLLAE